MHIADAVTVCLVLAVSAPAQRAFVVPATASTSDANSLRWVAGAVGLRQQTVIDAAHITALVGRRITALSLRRDADYSIAFVGGDVDLRVRLAHGPFPADSVTPDMDRNLGGAGVDCFRGRLTLPYSPRVNNGAVPWDVNNTLRIALAQPFRYVGGPLVIDVLGVSVGENELNWPMDAVRDSATGTVVPLGSSCQRVLGSPSGQTAFVGPGDLVPGSTVSFAARGTPHAAAILLLGFELPAPIDLTPLGLLGCSLWLQSVVEVPTSFGPLPPRGLPPHGGTATVDIALPPRGALLGARLTAQWADLGRSVTLTNALRCELASLRPALGVTHVWSLYDGVRIPVIGHVDQGFGHVWRFEVE